MTSSILSHLSSSMVVDKLDLIWQMGLASLSSTGNELRLPLSISNKLEVSELKELEQRLSSKFDRAPAYMFADENLQVFRICVVLPEAHVEASPSPSLDSADASSSTSPSSTIIESKLRAFGKKSRVPRPPNAFIIYRQKMHPQIKAANPGLHNNDISVILGKKWKSESEQVKNFWKLRAEQIKLQHAIDNPGYQYTPRKPAEKKRRMTARKRAQLNEQDHDTSDFPNANDSITAAHGLPAQQSLPSLTNVLGVNPDSSSGISFTHHDHMQLNLPSPHGLSVAALNFTNALQNNHNLVGGGTFQTQVANHVNNSNDFLNSLIDWDTFAENGVILSDRPLDGPVDGDDSLDCSALDEVDSSLPYNFGSDQFDLAAFQEELQRISKLI